MAARTDERLAGAKAGRHAVVARDADNASGLPAVIPRGDGRAGAAAHDAAHSDRDDPAGAPSDDRPASREAQDMVEERDTPEVGDPSQTQRIDRWLWFTRMAKSRTLAASWVSDGKVRINRVKVDKPAHVVRPGDIVTLVAHRRVHVLKCLQPGARRGPATQAQTLYEDITPEDANPKPPSGLAGLEGTAGRAGGRPTKRDRRAMDKWRQQGGGPGAPEGRDPEGGA